MAKSVLAEGYLGEKKVLAQDPWPELYDAMRLGLIMQGKVTGIEKNEDSRNLVVFMGPIKGIISQEESGLQENQILQGLVGTTVAFKVKHCDRSKGIVYLSRKEALEEMSSRTWQELKNDAKELIKLSEKVKELYAMLQPDKAEQPANAEEAENTDKNADNLKGIDEIEDKDKTEENGASSVKEISEDERKKIEQELSEIRVKMREVGPVRTCVVKYVTPYGAYVDIGGITGYIPRYEISWGYVEDARDYLQQGDAFDAKLINISDSGVTASIKLLLPDPWETAGTKYSKGGIYTGKVVKELTRGMLIELEPGVTAFVPHLPFGNPYPGSEVLFKAGRIDTEKRRMSGWVVRVLRRAV
jgi:ribosomal protein S1